MTGGAGTNGGLFSRKSIESSVDQAQQSGYVRALGALDLTGIGIAAVIGAGIFFLLGLEAGTTGPAVMLSLLVSGLAAVMAALSYAEFASVIPGSGSAYAYAYAAFGRLPAFVMGWLFLNSYMVGNAGVSIGWSDFFASALAGLGLPLPDALLAGPADGGVVNLPAMLVVAVVTLLCLPRIRESTRVNNALVAVKVLIVLFVIGFGAFFVDPANWTPFSPAGWDGVAASAAVLFFAYLGFDTVAATAEEAKNPRRDLPLGIVLSVTVCMVLYLAMAAVVTGMSSSGDLQGRAPVAAAFADAGHPWAAGLVTAGALVGLGTVVYAFHLALARILQAMARDGFLPRRLARLHPTTGTPWAATIWIGVVTALVAGFVPLANVIDMTVDASIAIYVLVAVGILALRRLRPDMRARVRPPAAIHVLAAVLLVAIVAFGIGVFIHLVFLAWVALGLVVYGFWAHRAVARAEAEPAGA